MKLVPDTKDAKPLPKPKTVGAWTTISRLQKVEKVSIVLHLDPTFSTTASHKAVWRAVKDALKGKSSGRSRAGT